MKKIISVIAVLFISLSLFAIIIPPVPEKMSYQAVIRNSSNVLVTSHLVGMRISILQYTSTGTAVYVETQTPTTNVNGLATIEIGKGTIVSGVFSTIDWSAGPYFIKTETDPAGGTAYTITATSELISVPYALMAKNAKNATNLTLPFSNSGSYATTPFTITNTGSDYYTIVGISTNGYGIYGKTNDGYFAGVIGVGSGTDISCGVSGKTGEVGLASTPANCGVSGRADAHIGVAGTAISGIAGYFKSNSGFALNTIGKLKLTGIGEAAGSILTSDATGNASWVAPLWKQYSATKIYYDAGWVGIGHTTPEATLDVEGTVKIGTSGKIFSEIREITGTTGATGYYSTVTYPTGYTMANTRVLSVEINSSGSVWVGLGYNYANTANIPISYYLSSGSTIYIFHPAVASMHSRAFRVMLMKVQ